MDLANAAITTLVVGVVGALVTWGMSGKFRSLERELDARFTGVNQRFDLVDHRFDLVDQRFEQVDQRFEQVDRRFDQVDRRFEQVDQRFDQVDHRFERVEAAVDGLRSDVTQIALALGARPRAENG
jgi:uncharacterized protein (DUF3084 family)